ncbi:hypothetical protein MXD58_016700 [Frankia sp. AgKG'84/4]|nr:hypothetical protein [Frankia sp. AgKG'84/4]MCL9795910.1 hypothetical protein [Frankia sp. AgKG'84/4]
MATHRDGWPVLRETSGQRSAAVLKTLDEQEEKPRCLVGVAFGGYGDAVGETEQFADREVRADGRSVLSAGDMSITELARPR